MKKNAQRQTRIAIIDDRTDDCAVCQERALGCHFDHDLAALNHGNGFVCYGCSAYLIFGEDELLKTPGICLSSDAMPPMPEDPHSSIP